MNSFFVYLTQHTVISLFLIVGLGLALGSLSLRKFSLGSSGVLFIALLFGHFGVTIPKEIGDLGVILFVYAVGLQAGPRFFHSIQRNGLTYLIVAVVSLLVAATTIVIYSRIMGLHPALAVGIFAGSLTSTPGLAAALDVLQDPTVSVGYGIAYPLGIFLKVMFVQWVAESKQTKQELREEKSQIREGGNQIRAKQYWVTNPNCAQKMLIEINLHSMTEANITRVRRGDKVMVAHGDTVLQLNDVVRATGTERELQKLEQLIGAECNVDMDTSQNIVVKTVFISSPKVAGKSLRDLEVKEIFGVVISRLRRDDLLLVPTGSTTLEVGDLIHVVGDKDDVDAFMNIVGQQERRLQETNLLPLSCGIVLGTLLGTLPLHLPGGVTFSLGIAGGPLLVALIVSHFGRIGKISVRTPYATKYFAREIGLVFFLAAAGTKAGGHFIEVLHTAGLQLFLYGAITTFLTLTAAFMASRLMFRLSNLVSLGLVCGSLTSTPALGVVTGKVDSDTPTLAYASVYAMALVMITVLSQLLALML